MRLATRPSGCAAVNPQAGRRAALHGISGVPKLLVRAHRRQTYTPPDLDERARHRPFGHVPALGDPAAGASLIAVRRLLRPLTSKPLQPKAISCRSRPPDRAATRWRFQDRDQSSLSARVLPAADQFRHRQAGTRSGHTPGAAISTAEMAAAQKRSATSPRLSPADQARVSRRQLSATSGDITSFTSGSQKRGELVRDFGITRADRGGYLVGVVDRRSRSRAPAPVDHARPRRHATAPSGRVGSHELKRRSSCKQRQSRNVAMLLNESPGRWPPTWMPRSGRPT